ncbi:MAG: TRAP transporter substrate-binding protein DctP [Methylobacteriaceae bacterium]|jgi:TRAP-type C4-dicarboxylate transport system substrate-binding protein|nr:TRAP transporter substrate-binding protein DctP [Methylobacteriaceae bacterium]
MASRSVVSRRLTLLLLSAFIAAPLSAQAQEKIEWRFFSYVSPTDFHSSMNKAMADDITAATGGRLTITHYGAGELPYKSGDVIKAVATNQIQMGQVGAGLVAGDAPELDVFSVPFLCTDFAGFKKAVDAIGDIPDKVLTEKFKVRVLMNWPIPGQNIWTTAKVDRIPDLKGKKIRTWNPMQVEMLQKLGAIPTSIDPSEVVTALQRKVVDGAITSALTANDWKAYELIKYGFMLNFTMAHQITIANVEALDKLPPDLRKIVDDKIAEWTPKYFAGAEAADKTSMDNMTAHGVVLTSPTPEDVAMVRELLHPMWEAWAQQNGPVAQDLLAKVMKATQ